MSDLNQCNFIGRLGDNPQMRTTQSGEPMATFSIAVSEKWNDKQGNRQERTEWVNIQAFGKLAEIMGQYLQKGSQVFISGKLQSRKYTGQDGIERTATSILADTMQMLGSRTDGKQAPQANNGYLQQSQGQGQWGQQPPQGYPQAPQGQPSWGNPPPQQGQQPPQRPIGMTSSLYQPPHPTTAPMGQPTSITPPMGNGGQVPDEDMPF